MTEQPDYRDLFGRPGFLIRRLHQIHVALFAEECGGLNVTPVHYSLMTVLSQRPGIDQVGLAEEVGIDRATVAEVLTRLEARGLLVRSRKPDDRRMKEVRLTASGAQLLADMDGPAKRAHERTIEALPETDRRLLMSLLSRLVDAQNSYGRAKLRLPENA